jgi:hypothetical protein
MCGDILLSSDLVTNSNGPIFVELNIVASGDSPLGTFYDIHCLASVYLSALCLPTFLYSKIIITFELQCLKIKNSSWMGY